MSHTTTTPSQAVNLRGMQCRAAFAAKRMKKPMGWIEMIYPALDEADKTMLRRWLLGRAPATMSEALMRKGEAALERLNQAAA